MAERALQGKNIAMVIAFREFRDIEYFIPRDVLAGAGARITTVSSQKGLAIGTEGGEVRINLTAQEIQTENYDAMVFIGGPGMGKKINDENFQRIAKEAVAKGKVLGAICVAPALLAKASVLQGKKATVWSSPLDKSAVRILTEEGAQYLSEEVVIDGKLITASGPFAAKKFGEALVEALTNG